MYSPPTALCLTVRIQVKEAISLYQTHIIFSKQFEFHELQFRVIFSRFERLACMDFCFEVNNLKFSPRRR